MTLFPYFFPTLLIYLKRSFCSYFFGSLQQTKCNLSSRKLSFNLNLQCNFTICSEKLWSQQHFLC